MKREDAKGQRCAKVARGRWAPLRLGVLAVVFFAACEGGTGDDAAGADGGMDAAALRALPVPAEHAQGREVYEATCAVCHGEAGMGTAQGPPLVHIIYEPNHHGDAAFILAAERGVPAHHWGFGDMPPQPGVTRAEVTEVVGYIRWLQREAGVY